MNKWLLEPEIYKEDEQPLMQALTVLGVHHVTCQFGRPYEDYINMFTSEEKVIFHGSLQFGKLIKNGG